MTTVTRQKVCPAQELYIDVPRERNIWAAQGKGGLSPRGRDNAHRWLETGAWRAGDGSRRGTESCAGRCQAPCRAVPGSVLAQGRIPPGTGNAAARGGDGCLPQVLQVRLQPVPGGLTVLWANPPRAEGKHLECPERQATVSAGSWSGAAAGKPCWQR